MGALPDSQIQAFIQKLTGPKPPSEAEQLLAAGTEALELGDLAGAAQAFAQVLQTEPENLKALAGLSRCYLLGGDVERAAELVAMAPAGAKSPELDSVKAALLLAQTPVSNTAAFEARLAADPKDHEARFELAKALAAQGNLQWAADELLALIGQEPGWNDGAARKQLLTIFEAAGPMSDLAKQGRRRLSAILFS
jgi:putative thioredoxin